MLVSRFSSPDDLWAKNSPVWVSFSQSLHSTNLDKDPDELYGNSVKLVSSNGADFQLGIGMLAWLWSMLSLRLFGVAYAVV